MLSIIRGKKSKPLHLLIFYLRTVLGLERRASLLKLSMMGNGTKNKGIKDGIYLGKKFLLVYPIQMEEPSVIHPHEVVCFMAQQFVQLEAYDSLTVSI